MTASPYTTLQQGLATYQALTAERLHAYIPRTEPRRFLYDLVNDYPQRGGKGFRPGLCIATCQALGGHLERVLNSAVALELFHNAFLVHDDIEDESLLRRGRPTMHQSYGTGIAINVGDAMNVLSIRPLMDNLQTLGPNLTWRIFTQIEHMVRQTVEGQALELGWRRENSLDLTERDYLNMILKKTCWYTCIHPMRIGALIATGDDTDLERFNRLGYYLGASFQIQDDLLNLVGDVERYGKEIGGDLVEGKRTLMLIYLLRDCSAAERKRLETLLHPDRHVADAELIHEIMGLMHKYGSIPEAQRAARQLAGAALNEFTRLFAGVAASPHRDFLQDFVLYMIQRNH
ncbi:polyprenyl synthetase family protein [Lewinella sp. IMCC34183]|uniref:polyprenyl synthetase family protein n=1 Tax=Lewinella sp. IMCC34183 TaxID=2248762 RepID=UPI000E2553A8|nr:polyprenyl synthetase family protein [Lewinella sp. IMCC34183]